LTALDVESGKILWTGRTSGKYQNLVGNDRVILALINTGELPAIEPHRERLKILDREQVADNSWAHLGCLTAG